MANDVNAVIIIGRLTKDMELSYTQGGMAVGKFSFAVNRSIKSGDNYESTADFFDILVFGKSAEALKQYMIKGKQVAINGSLRQDRWEKDGKKFSKVHIVATNVQLLGTKNDGGGAERAASNEFGDYKPKARQEEPVDVSPDGFPEDIPF